MWVTDRYGRHTQVLRCGVSLPCPEQAATGVEGTGTASAALRCVTLGVVLCVLGLAGLCCYADALRVLHFLRSVGACTVKRGWNSYEAMERHIVCSHVAPSVTPGSPERLA